MIGFICVMHKCKDCARNTFEPINNFIKSLYKFCKKDFVLYLFDNASDEKYNVPNFGNIKYEYIEDQSLRGLAGPYNDGIISAIEDDCDIIVLINDDIILNETINDFFDIIKNHKYKNVGLYGPLTNGLNKNKSFQEANKPDKGIREITKLKRSFGVLNGFLVAFTKQFYEKFKMRCGRLCDPKCLWKGGERALRKRVIPNGGRMFIIKDCWVLHNKIGGWKKLIRSDKNKSRNKTKNRIKK